MDWRARFFEESVLFSPIRDAASLFAHHETFPSPEEIDLALHARAGVRFVRKQPREKLLYDTRIVNEGVVPTRAGSWHDFLNALVWATFPRAKAALHRRQFELVVPRAPRRTKEQDALAMVDEGGVFCLSSDERLVFGHAIYEGQIMGRRALGAGLDLSSLSDCTAGYAEVDRRAAEILADREVIRSPRDLLRVPAVPTPCPTP